MKEVAAYVLCLLGGNKSPDAAAVKSVITAAGGEADDPGMKKNDLLQILPGDLSELMLWMATDQGKNFE